MRPQPHPAYSYREDPQVPAFDETRIHVVMDAECALCSRAARRIARLDREDAVRIAPAQGALGQALLRHYGMRPDDPETWLLVEEGHAYGSLDAMLRLFPRLSGIYAPLRVLSALPFGLQDWIYARIARNRYRIFGRADLCALPDASVQSRLVR